MDKNLRNLSLLMLGLDTMQSHLDPKQESRLALAIHVDKTGTTKIIRIEDVGHGHITNYYDLFDSHKRDLPTTFSLTESHS